MDQNKMLRNVLLLMVQKSGKLTSCYISHYLQGFSTIQKVVGTGISEPSTVWIGCLDGVFGCLDGFFGCLDGSELLFGFFKLE